MGKRYLYSYVSPRVFMGWMVVILLCEVLAACSSQDSDVEPAGDGDVETRSETEPSPRAAGDAEIGSETESKAQKVGGGADASAIGATEYPAWEIIQRNWPTFRGPGANGVAHYTNAPVSWDVETGTAIRWKVKVPLAGTNSPVVWDNRLFLSGADEEVREVYSFDTETGQLLWTRTVGPFKNTPVKSLSVNEETGYAASTMAVDGSRAFAIFSNGDIVSYDFEGNLLWGYNLGVFDNHYGHSSSLMEYEGLLFVQLDQISGGKLIALHTATGKEAWSKERDHISWASPIIAVTPFGEQLILASEINVDAYDPGLGKLIWSVSCLGGEVAPSPAYRDGIVFVANEYAQGTAIKLGGSEDAVEPEILWEWDEILPEVSSPAGDGERFYIATSIGDLVCLDANTGEALWIEEVSNGFYSSPVVVGDKVYTLDMEGTMYIVRAGPEYELIGTPSLGEMTLATPAFLDGRIYIRTDEHILCVE